MEHTKRVIALGFFDGVHLGHGALLRLTVSRAGELGCTPAAISFDTPPAKAVNGDTVQLILSPTDRADAMARHYGINDLILLRFDDNTRRMDWRSFIVMLKDTYNAVHLVAGYDFRFGYKGEGNADKLRTACRELGIGCDIVDSIDFDGTAVKSTNIRQLLTSGDVEGANRLLGHRYFLTGTVLEGYKLGRTLGTPTINMRYEDGVLVPRMGVYAAMAHMPDTGESFPAVTNIGVRPTVGGVDAVSVESFLLGFSGDLYGKRVRVEFYKFLRPERKFSGTEELREQILKDAENTKTYFSE